MSRKGENIYKRKDGRWEGRYIKKHENGKAHYGSVYAYSYKDAKNKLYAARQQMEKSEKSILANAETVSSVSTMWMKESAHILKESSLIKYEDILRNYILPTFGEYELSKITNKQLIDFGNMLSLKGGVHQQGLAASTILEIMSVMNSIRIYAMHKDCNVSFSTECVSIKRSSNDIRVLSVYEENCLVDYLYNHINLTGLGILLCLFTGIRLGEVCALNWNDFCMSEGVLRINKTMQRIRTKDNFKSKTEVKIFEPKSDRSIRTIPIPENLIELLKTNYKEGTFFLTGHKEKFVEPRTLQYRFKAILKKCGIEDANFHTTRHTFATRCVEQGFDIKCLSEILGHASVTMTLNRYVHPSMNLKSKNMELISGLYPIPKETETRL